MRRAALLNSVINEFGSQKSDEGKTYAEAARAVLSRIDARPSVGLEVGDIAPEISGPNTEGESMRLSGSRGSVVAVVFWANWCPWCHDVHPFSRSVKSLVGERPFVLLGVNGDGARRFSGGVMAEESVNWPNWWLGKNPEIMRDYKQNTYPTMYLLDQKGVIRFRAIGNFDERSITRAANGLLDAPIATRTTRPNRPPRRFQAPRPKSRRARRKSDKPEKKRQHWLSEQALLGTHAQRIASGPSIFFPAPVSERLQLVRCTHTRRGTGLCPRMRNRLENRHGEVSVHLSRIHGGLPQAVS